MKLADVKDKIEKYFNEIDPDELYEKALSYGFKEVDKEADIDSFEDIFEAEKYFNYDFFAFNEERKYFAPSEYEDKELELLGVAA
jgi:hypothetical protein